MSAATALALEKPQRLFQRHPINIPLDLIVLRSGVPETLPGRCTDLSEAGVGAVVAGELIPGQQVAVELRLPNVGVPVRVRALVSYQSKLRCGLEFVALSFEQREMIRYWAYSSGRLPLALRHAKKKGGFVIDATEKIDDKTDGKADFKKKDAKPGASTAVARYSAKPGRRIRIVRRGLYLLVLCILALVGLGWWQWQRSWNELEKQSLVGQSDIRVSSETMEKKLVTKIDPNYPEAARVTGTEGLVVLDAVIGQDGNVKRLWPVSGSDMLVQSATDAVQLWKFEPYLLSGKAVEVETTLAVEFRLN